MLEDKKKCPTSTDVNENSFPILFKNVSVINSMNLVAFLPLFSDNQNQEDESSAK